MSEELFELLSVYGLWLIALVTLLSCLAVPVPASLMMVAGGAFAASGDLSLGAIVAAALGGAIVGDQLGYAIGRRGSSALERLENANGRRQELLARSRRFAERWGRSGVFLSRWLFSPLGPYVNFIGGATGMNWAAFSISAAAGEVIWVTSYTGLGFLFSNQIEMVSDIAANFSGFLAATVVALVLGRLLLRPPGSRRRKKP
ncbi:MAG: DedA family protein [Paracoccaceae bacterium]